jgi:hypothetical protein
MHRLLPSHPRAVRPRTSRRLACAALLAVLGGCGLTAPAAMAATWTAAASDPVGDGPTPARDIAYVSYRSNSRGSVRVVVQTAGPIDAANADAAVGISVGSNCKRVVLSGGGLFSEPDPVFFAKISGQSVGKDREGRGVINGATYTLSVKHSSFKTLRPKCLAVVLADATTGGADAPTVFDQTGELAITR